MSKELLKYIGECSAYSAKGHFKSSDLRRITNYFYITINLGLSIICLTDLVSNLWLKISGIVSLLASVLLLLSETHGGLSICSKHEKYGNLFLELHNDSLLEYNNQNANKERIEKLMLRLNDLNKQNRPNINLIGKYWAKFAITNLGEMKVWWE